MKVCTDCHAEVEPGWQYCHTCGATATSPVYLIRGGETPEPDGPSLPGSAFMALLEGRPVAPAGQFDDADTPGTTAAPEPPAPLEPVTSTGPAPELRRLTAPAVPLTPHLLPEHRGLSVRAQKVAVTVAALLVLGLGAATLQLRSDLGATRARLQTTQEELDRTRSAESPR